MRRATIFLVAMGACGVVAGPEVANTPDAGFERTSDGSAPRLELQTGGPDVLQEFADGDELLLQRGCQGSQHIFVSARGWGFEGERLTIELQLERIRDAQVVSLPLTLRLPFMDEAPEGARQATGLTLVVPDPSDVVGENVRLRGTLRDPSGAVATGTRAALIQWGPDACGGHG